MDGFSWLAVYRDGRLQERWQDGVEQKPGPGVAEFHLLPHPAAIARGLRPYSLFLRGKEELVYFKRLHADAISIDGGVPVPLGEGLDPVFVLGIRAGGRPSAPVVYTFVLPDGRVEVSTDREHATRYERNFEAHPPRFYECWPAEEIPGYPGEEPRWPGEYDRALPVPERASEVPPEKIDPPLPAGYERNAKEFEADAVVTSN